ncbi:MAG: 4Fe-4S dicluster domain-containing protein [Rhodocyclaceae bacterium]|nr:4Fe-4S dicluster domain-containing protein [Rhodocyclaceae bacterium]
MISRRQFLRGKFSAPQPAPTTPVDPSAPALAVIGVACIALAKNVVCRSCGDACDAAAIRFSPRLGAAACPVILADRCTGCGDCIPVCPASAIHLSALAVPAGKR